MARRFCLLCQACRSAGFHRRDDMHQTGVIAAHGQAGADPRRSPVACQPALYPRSVRPALDHCRAAAALAGTPGQDAVAWVEHRGLAGSSCRRRPYPRHARLYSSSVLVCGRLWPVVRECGRASIASSSEGRGSTLGARQRAACRSANNLSQIEPEIMLCRMAAQPTYIRLRALEGPQMGW